MIAMMGLTQTIILRTRQGRLEAIFPIIEKKRLGV